MPVPVRAIDRLRKAANLEPAKKTVTLSAVSYTHLTLPTIYSV